MVLETPGGVVSNGAWPLNLELVGICGNDYESFELIKRQLDEPIPSDGEILECLRQLQSRGWMQCYRYVLERVAPDPGPDATLEEKSKQWRQEFTLVVAFEDQQVGELWWLSTEVGVQALKGSEE